MIAAAGVSAAWWWFGVSAGALVMTHEWWPAQPWRLLTSALPHGGVLHLVFNLYWLWAFGTFIEQRLGHLKTGGMLVIFAAGSAAAEFAFLEGGVGLSGVGYGLFGFLWVASRESRRFAGAIDERTTQIFIGWFVLCIVLTLLNVLRIANIAHGVGAVLGIVLGLVYVNSGVRRHAMAALLAALLLASGIAASVARPYVNLSPRAAMTLEASAYLALITGDHEQAVRLYRQLVIMDKTNAAHWSHLVVALEALGRHDQAAEAMKKYHEIRARP